MMLATETNIETLLRPSSTRPQLKARQALIVPVGQTNSKERVVSYEDLENLVDVASRMLRQRGVGPQQRVLLTSPNNPELIAFMLATWRLGGIAVPLDFRLTPNEVENVALRIKAKALVASSQFIPDLSYTFAKISSDIAIVDLVSLTNSRDDAIERHYAAAVEEARSGSHETRGARSVDGAEESSDAGDGAHGETKSQRSETRRGAVSSGACIQRRRRGYRADGAVIDTTAPALVILTSGTTGTPKGAVHDLGTLVRNMAELGELVHMNATKQAVLPLPVSHIFGLEVLFTAILYGASVVLSELSPTNFIQCLKKYSPQILAGVPTIYGALLASAKQQAFDLSKAEILLCGGAPLPLSLAEEFEKALGRRINNGYGSTESKIIALNLDGPLEAVGKTIPSVKILIMNEKDEALPEGQEGEICIDGSIFMQGYLDQPDVTRQVLHNGHYHTGDIGYLKDDYLYISGRAKEMIIVAGNKVFPSEVEDVLRKNPIVKEVAVLGRPHRQLGQLVKAVVVIEDEFSDGLTSDEEKQKQARQELLAQLKNFSKENLKRELRPMEWELRPASQPLPKTFSGKVDKKQLSER